MKNNVCNHLVGVCQTEGGMNSYNFSEVMDYTMKQLDRRCTDVFTFCPYCGVKIPYAKDISEKGIRND